MSNVWLRADMDENDPGSQGYLIPEPIEHSATSGTGHGFIPSTWFECPQCKNELDHGMGNDDGPNHWYKCDHCEYRYAD